MNKLFFIVCCVLIIFCCKKDNLDNINPAITINSPTASQHYNVLDVITITGSITDNRNIESVTISLLDANNIHVLNSIALEPNTASVLLNEQMEINNVHLSSGSYSLKIKASDGINHTDYYVEIYISESPTIRQGSFVFSNTGSITQITKLDNGLNATPFATLNGDFLNGFVNSYYQEVVACGKVSGNLIALSSAGANQNWMISNNVSGWSFFTGLMQIEKEYFVGYYDGSIKSFTQNGTPKFSAQAFVNSYCENLFVHQNNLLIAEEPEIAGSKIRLVSYYLATGIIKDNFELNEDVVGMYSKSANEVILFTNVSGVGTIKIYDTYLNSTWTPFSLYSGTITSSTALSQGVYLVAQGGDVVLVNATTSTKLPYLTGIGANIVKYDSQNKEVYVSSGNLLTVYDYTTKTVKGSYYNPSNILAIDFWYNK